MSESVSNESKTLKCKFCSSPVFPHYDEEGKIDSYYCGCDNFKNYLVNLITLQELEATYKTKKEALVEQLNSIAKDSDFYKKLVILINLDKEADKEKRKAKARAKLIDLTKFIKANDAHKALQKELEEYYWFPNI